MDEYLTVNEVAEALKLNPQTVRNWIDRGELPAVRAGNRRIRVRRDVFEERFGAAADPPVPPGPQEVERQAVPPLATDEVVEAFKHFSEAALKLALALERSRP